MKFDVILADPPWTFGDELKAMKASKKRSARSQYSLMSVSDIQNLEVKKLANPSGCVLALWVPSTLLADGMDVMKSWGFSLKQTYVWVKLKKEHEKEAVLDKKTRIGMGRLFRQVHEIALVGTSGKSVYKMLRDKSQRSVSFDVNVGHSVKPETLHKKLNTMFPDANKLELFGRRQVAGWTVVGDGVTGVDIRESIKDLIEG